MAGKFVRIFFPMSRNIDSLEAVGRTDLGKVGITKFSFFLRT